MSDLKRINRLAWWASLVAWVGLITFVVLAALELTWVFFPFDEYTKSLAVSSIAENYLDSPFSVVLTNWQEFIGLLLLLASSLPGVFGIYIAIRLLSHFREGNIFTLFTARSIRLIGWCIVFIGPVEELCQTLGTAYFTFLNNNAVKVTIEIGDSFFFSLVFGLVFVTIGHIMVEASNISEENKSFV